MNDSHIVQELFAQHHSRTSDTGRFIVRNTQTGFSEARSDKSTQSSKLIEKFLTSSNDQIKTKAKSLEHFDKDFYSS